MQSVTEGRSRPQPQQHSARRSMEQAEYRRMCSMTAMDRPTGKLRCVQPGVEARRCKLDAICHIWLKASSAVFGPIIAVQAVSNANQASKVVVPGVASASYSEAHTGR